MAGRLPPNVGLPLLTNGGDQTKIQVALHEISPTKPYQEYRYPVLTMRNPLVDLVWSPWALPGLTNSPIWLYSYRVRPLPIITTADRGLGIDMGVVGGVAGWPSVVATWAVW